MTPDQKLSYLKDEYLLLQKFYDDFDARVMTIKGWSATIGMAAIGVGFYQSRFVWLFAAGAALVFWILEATWKTFQYMYRPRIALLERTFLTGQTEEVAPFQIQSSWGAAFRRKRFEVVPNMFLGLILFPHALTIVAGIGLFVAETLGWMVLPRK